MDGQLERVMMDVAEKLKGEGVKTLLKGLLKRFGFQLVRLPKPGKAGPGSEPATEYYRSERYRNIGMPNISFQELAVVPTCLRHDEDPYKGLGRGQLTEIALKKTQWRYHHDVDALKRSPALYQVYAKRVDTMMRMVDRAIDYAGLGGQLGECSAADLACSEGFIAMRYLSRGLKSIDCFELNLDQIEKLQIIKNLRGIEEGLNVFRTDLEHPVWSQGIGRKYDLVFCLGIVYHMENPMLFLRNVYNITDRACVIESDTPLNCPQDRGMLTQKDSYVTKKPGDVRYILELRPNRRAVVDMLLNVGFSSVRIIEHEDDAECVYLMSGAKSVFLAMK